MAEPLKKFLPAQKYDLAGTLTSGQAFRWLAHEGGWLGFVGANAVVLRQEAEGITGIWLNGPPDWPALEVYLQTRIDLDAITDSFPNDEPLRAAVAACPGLRLLRQDPWECLASFILSSTKQIVQIQQIVQALCECYGERVVAPSMAKSLYAFPSAERLAGLDEGQLRYCKMGFRAPYLLKTAQIVAAGKLDLESLRALPTQKAREALVELPGVGEKIANCVLLFAYGFQDAFPVDVWVQRAVTELYFPRRKPTQKRLRHFIETHFGSHAGYAQQYLFHYMRVRKTELAPGA